MYKHLFFLDSKTLDWLTPYILVLASDTIAFNVFVLTFVSVVAIKLSSSTNSPTTHPLTLAFPKQTI